MTDIEIFSAKKLKELAKVAEYQSIKLDNLRIDIGFNADIGITEYDVCLIPVFKGRPKHWKTKQHFFPSYKEMKAFVQNEINLHG